MKNPEEKKEREGGGGKRECVKGKGKKRVFRGEIGEFYKKVRCFAPEENRAGEGRC